MDACRICLGPLRWKGRGRPPVYCAAECRRRARYLRSLGRAADAWARHGYPSREAHVRGAINRRLAEWGLRAFGIRKNDDERCTARGCRGKQGASGTAGRMRLGMKLAATPRDPLS